MNNLSTQSESFDVFLCHNSEDKCEIRRISDDLTKKGIKPWLDEDQIKPGTLWQSALEEQISNIKSVTVFVGESGIGPWQNLEIRTFINEFVERKCPVIPAILPSTKKPPPLPILLKNLHYVDFRVSNPNPLEQLLWGITGNKPNVQTILDNESSDGLALLPGKNKQLIEIRLPGKLDSLSSDAKEKLLNALSTLLQIDGEIKITECRPGSTRLFLELTPEDADKIYAAAQSGQLGKLGITEARLYPSLSDPPDKNQRSQLLMLLNRVNEFWIDGILKPSLYHEVLISLDKRAMDDAVEPPWNRTIALPKQRRQFSLSNTRIESVFDATGLLLILGEPGSGKTTTLLELASNLIARAKVDAKERIPFILNLSSWKKRQSLIDWMSSELSNIYRVPKKLALCWVGKGYLVPLLDGLDEVTTEHQADCVEAINAYITQAEPSGLVVCCRLMEYQWLPEHLKLNGAICIESLNIQQIDQYFFTIGPELSSLRGAIKEDTALQELTQSPLMLNIMSMAYQSATEDCFRDRGHTLEEHRKQIFDTYVDRMFQRKASLDQIFPKEKVVFWLSWLAKKMLENSQSAFFVESLQPNWLDSWRSKLTYRSVSSLIFAFTLGLIVMVSSGSQLDFLLLFWLITALAIGMSVRFDSSIKNSIICGLCSGLLVSGAPLISHDWLHGSPSYVLMIAFLVVIVVGPLVGICLGTLNSIKTVETVSWSWKLFFEKMLKGFFIGGLIFGLLGGLVGELNQGAALNLSSAAETGLERLMYGIEGGLYSPLGLGLTFGLSFGIISGMIYGIIGGFTNKIKEHKALPNHGIILTFKNGAFAGFISIPIIVLTLWLIRYPIGTAYYSSLSHWMAYPLSIGLIVGLNRGLGAVLKHYILRLILWLSGKTPFKFIPFLDYCAKLILLKKVGGGYIFIHRMLLEYFAKLGANTKP